VGVKNTFIDIREAETPDAAQRGSQTAMARMGAAEPPLFSPQGIPEMECEAAYGVETEDPDNFNGYRQKLTQDNRQGSWVCETPFNVGEKDNSSSTLSTATGTSGRISISDGEIRFDQSGSPFIPGGAIPPPPMTQAPGAYQTGAQSAPYAVSPVVGPPMMTGAPSSGNSPFSASQSPVPAPPAYAAPIAFDHGQEETTPPPQSTPGSQAARGFGPELNYTVKNTFIDVEVPDDLTTSHMRQSQTCQARFSAANEAHLQFYASTGSMSVGPPGHPTASTNTPTGAGSQLYNMGSPGGACAMPQGPLSPSSGAPPSIGSVDHERIGPDGQPVCQPCAWFYKDSGCRNAQSCRYCHLCPSGELKNRKKIKIARLRNQEAEAAQGASSPAATPKAS
jgi:hypothetical protein